MFKWLKRQLLLAQIYAVNIEIADKRKALRYPLHKDLRSCIEAGRTLAESERSTLQAKHDALLPIGQRRIWAS